MNANKTLLASALAAVGASLCCVAPLVLVMLGIGGAWVSTLTQLEPIRPLFVLLALGLMAVAWRQLYHSVEACESNKPCADGYVRQRQKLIFWLVSLPLLGLLAFPWYAHWFY
jgi:mercuric ion transport protein